MRLFFFGIDHIHVLIDNEEYETRYYHTPQNPRLRCSMSFREEKRSGAGLGVISVVEIMPWGAGVLLPRTPRGNMFTHVLIDTEPRETFLDELVYGTSFRKYTLGCRSSSTSPAHELCTYCFILWLKTSSKYCYDA